MKKLLLLLTLFGSLAFTACEIDDPHDNHFEYFEVPYTGDLVVIPFSGGNTYTWPQTRVGLGEEKDGTLTLWLYNTRFVPPMPPMEMAIPYITYAATPTLTSMLIERTVPYVGGRPYEQYVVTNLSGTVTGNLLNVTFNCMGYRVTFVGTKDHF